MAVGAYSMGARLHLRVSDVQKSEQDFITLLEVVGREVKVLILFLIKEDKNIFMVCPLTTLRTIKVIILSR
jgi:hypothetical protein